MQKTIRSNRRLKLIEPGIFSALEGVQPKHDYDRMAPFYDTVVGTRVYNAAVWGSSPAAYTRFAATALDSRIDGPMLDAGCGSLLFTASLYRVTRRPIIAFDQSISMLRRARSRLLTDPGSVPENIVLLQADLEDLPFSPQQFSTVLFMNVLHHCSDLRTVVPELERMLSEDGNLLMTSLVSNKRLVGDVYLKMLYRSGKFARLRTAPELHENLRVLLKRRLRLRTEGNMAFIETVDPSDTA